MSTGLIQSSLAPAGNQRAFSWLLSLKEKNPVYFEIRTWRCIFHDIKQDSSARLTDLAALALAAVNLTRSSESHSQQLSTWEISLLARGWMCNDSPPALLKEHGTQLKAEGEHTS